MAGILAAAYPYIQGGLATYQLYNYLNSGATANNNGRGRGGGGPGFFQQSAQEGINFMSDMAKQAALQAGVPGIMAAYGRQAAGLGPRLDPSLRNAEDMRTGLFGSVFMQPGAGGGRNQYYAAAPGVPQPGNARPVYTPVPSDVEAEKNVTASDVYLGTKRMDANAKALTDLFLAQTDNKESAKAQVREQLLKHNAEEFESVIRSSRDGAFYGKRPGWEGSAKFLVEVM